MCTDKIHCNVWCSVGHNRPLDLGWSVSMYRAVIFMLYGCDLYT